MKSKEWKFLRNKKLNSAGKTIKKIERKCNNVISISYLNTAELNICL